MAVRGKQIIITVCPLNEEIEITEREYLALQVEILVQALLFSAGKLKVHVSMTDVKIAGSS